MNAPDSHNALSATQAQRVCDGCGNPYTPRTRHATRFCSSGCRMAWHNWTKTVKEARKLVGEALSAGTVSEDWKQRACKLLGIKEKAKA